MVRSIDELLESVHTISGVDDLKDNVGDIVDSWLHVFSTHDMYTLKEKLFPHMVSLDDDMMKFITYFSYVDWKRDRTADEADAHTAEVNAKLRNVIGIFQTIHHSVESDHVAELMIKGEAQAVAPLSLSTYLNILHWRDKGETPITPLVQVAAHFISILHSQGLRRDGTYIAYPVYNEMGDFVYAYERKKVNPDDPMSDYKTITRYLDELMGGIIENPEIHNKMASGSFKKDVVNNLTTVMDVRFQDYRPHRHQLSFRNCIFNLKRLTIHPYRMTAELQALRIPMAGHEDDETKGIPLVSAKKGAIEDYCSYHYIDQDLDIIAAVQYMRQVSRGSFLWERLPTPAMNKILRDQGLPLAVANVLYVMSGRFYFRVGEYERWQVIVQVTGEAGTGKTTYSDAIRHTFPETAVGMLNNIVRSGFPLQSIAGCRVFIANDIDESFSLPTTVFNNMVSGDKLHVDIMYDGHGRSLEWVAHGMITGNAPPLKFGNAGYCQDRRFITFEFTRKVDRDPRLVRMLRDERPMFILKSVLAYRHKAEYMRQHQQEDLFAPGVLPTYFTEQRLKLRRQLNPIEAFLSNYCEFGDDYHMPWAQFQDSYKTLMGDDARRKPLKETNYRDAFRSYRIRIEHQANLALDEAGVHLIGVCLRDA